MDKNHNKTQEDILNEISGRFKELDNSLDKEYTDMKNGHKNRAWYEEHHAIHEIRKILHDIGKYDKFDEKYYERFMKDYKKAIDGYNK